MDFIIFAVGCSVFVGMGYVWGRVDGIKQVFERGDK